MAGVLPEPSPAESLLTVVAAPRDDATLDGVLRRLESILALLGFHSSPSRFRLAVSCAAFALLGVAAPAAAVALSRCSASSGGCGEYQIDRFEVFVVVSQAALGGVSLACVSWNLRRHGMRNLLVVNRDYGRIVRFEDEYVRKIQGYCSLLLWLVLPCFLVKTAREVSRFLHIFKISKWKSVVVLSASLFSWVYLTSILLSACSLFGLVCSLQVIHFEDYGELLKRDVDASVCLQEHWHLHRTLSKISHRFRIFLLLLFLFVTASQFVILFQTTGFKGTVSFSIAGDLAVASVVQVVGVVLCMHAAAKISHKAQSIASLGSRWHAAMSCFTTDSIRTLPNTMSMHHEAISPSSSSNDCLENDFQLSNEELIQNHALITSNISSYHRRQALVLYLQSNPGGITIFGWTVDRGLLNTLFFLELTLVLFVLGKTIVFPS